MCYCPDEDTPSLTEKWAVRLPSDWAGTFMKKPWICSTSLRLLRVTYQDDSSPSPQCVQYVISLWLLIIAKVQIIANGFIFCKWEQIQTMISVSFALCFYESEPCAGNCYRPWCIRILKEVYLACEEHTFYVLGGKNGQVKLLSNKKELFLIWTIFLVGIKSYPMRPQENYSRTSMDILIGCSLASGSAC